MALTQSVDNHKKYIVEVVVKIGVHRTIMIHGVSITTLATIGMSMM